MLLLSFPCPYHNYCVATARLHQFHIAHYCTTPRFSLPGLACLQMHLACFALCFVALCLNAGQF